MSHLKSAVHCSLLSTVIAPRFFISRPEVFDGWLTGQRLTSGAKWTVSNKQTKTKIKTKTKEQISNNDKNNISWINMFILDGTKYRFWF